MFFVTLSFLCFFVCFFVLVFLTYLRISSEATTIVKGERGELLGSNLTLTEAGQLVASNGEDGMA